MFFEQNIFPVSYNIGLVIQRHLTKVKKVIDCILLSRLFEPRCIKKSSTLPERQDRFVILFS